MVLSRKYLIQCKICYRPTSGTNAFYLFYTVVNKTWVASIFSSVSSAAILNFKMAAIFSLFWAVFCPKTKHSHIFVIIIITYVS